MRFVFPLILSFLPFFFQKKDVFNQRQKIIAIGYNAYQTRDTLALKKSINDLYALYQSKKDSFFLAKHYHYKSLYYRINYTFDSTYYYLNKSKNISLLLKDSVEVGRRLLSAAYIQRKVKDNLGSQISSIEALTYLEPIKSYKYIERVYTNLGLVSHRLNKIKDAKKYYEKALIINKINNSPKDFMYLMNNLGILFRHQKKYEKAKKYFNEGLSFKNIKIKYPTLYAILLENLTICDHFLGNRDKVKENYEEVLKIRKERNNLSSLSTTHLNIASYYKDENNVKKRLIHLNKALKYAQQSHNNRRWLTALQNLAELTSGKESKQYFKEYIKLNDSLLQKERNLKNQFAKIRYETAKKEKENQLLKTENKRKQEEIVTQRQQMTIGWLAAVVGFLGLGISVMFFAFRRRQFQHRAQLQKAQARDEERRHIAKSLHDEIAGDLRVLHTKLQKSNLLEEAKKLDAVKENVRNLSHQLTSVSFDKVSFRNQIINLVSDYFELNFNIKVEGLDDYNWADIDDAIKRLFYLCIRESIQNSKKHGEASRVIVKFYLHKKNVFAEVSDNGIGFDKLPTNKGIGLQNLQERVEEVSGSFIIDSKLNKGTKILITIPLV